MDEEVEKAPVGDDASRRAWGARMRTLRRRAGLRQEDLAQRLGVTKRTVGSWEREGLPTGKILLVEAALGGTLGAEPVAGAESADGALAPLADLLDSLRQRVETLEQRLAEQAR